jgi:hypothetical protein
MTICAASINRSLIAKSHSVREHTTKGRPAKTSFRVPGLSRDIQVKIATEQEEFEEAFELLAANYRARGYEAPSDQPYRFTPHHALPGTVTLVAKHEGHVVATLSLVPDNAILGLPMESIYGEEIEQLRREGRKLAEVVSLADEGLSLREFIQVFKALIKLEKQYHARQGGDSWVITVNPRHRGFYQKVLGFASLGERRSYPKVQDHPAEAYLLDLELMATNAPQMYQEVFGDELPESVLTAGRWSVDRVRYFGSRSTQVEAQAIEDLLASIEFPEGPKNWT